MADNGYRNALIVGVGSGLSASLARAFSKRGIKVALAARRAANLAALAEDTSAKGFACDATDHGQVIKVFSDFEKEFGGPEVVVYNASYRTRGPFVTLDPAEVERSLAVTAFGAFLVAQEAAKRMVPREHGAILFTGASASVKGYAQSAPFAMGKFALRGLAQSMARELAPLGIHVGHVVSAVKAGRFRRTGRIACSTPTPSRRPISICCSSRAAHGRGKLSCGLGLRSSE